MRKFLKIILYGIGTIILLLLAAILFLVSPAGKKIVRDKALTFLRGKLKTEVYIGAVEYSFPKMVGLKDVLLKDQQKDTLLAVQLLKIDIDLLKLVNKKVSVNDLVLENIHVYVSRNKPDTAFNFTYIIDAFASKDTVKKANKASSRSSFVFDVGTVKLDDIHVRFKDGTGGMDLGVDLDHLRIRMKELDPEKMIFRLKSLSVNGLRTTFIQDTSLLVSMDTTTQAPIQLAVDELDLKQIAFKFKSQLTDFLFDVHMGHLLAYPKTIDILNKKLVVKNLLLDTTNATVIVGKQSTVPAKIDHVVDTLHQAGWTVALDKIKISNVGFVMDNEGRPKVKDGIDYAHLGVSELSLDAEQLHYSDDAVSGNLHHLSVKEKSGLFVQELRTNFFYNDTAASLKDLYAKTPVTVLQNNIEAKYPSIASLSKQMQLLQLNVQLHKSVIGIPDVLLFAPQLRQQEMFRRYANNLIKCDVVLNGYLNNLNIQQFHVLALGNTEVDLKGRLTGLPVANNIGYNLIINTFNSNRNDLLPFIPVKEQKNFRLPDAFRITGKVSGTLKDYYPDVALKSTDGNANIKGSLRMSKGSGREQYDLILNTQALNIGRIIKKDTLVGAITAAFKVKGTSFDMNKMTAEINGSIHSALVKGYGYRNISLDGKIANQQGEAHLVSDDPNAHLHINAQGDFRNKYPAFLADVLIDSMDLHALKLYDSVMRIQAAIHTNITALNLEYPDGVVTILKPVIATNNKVYALDSIYVASKPSSDSGQHIVANLDFMQALITGKTPLSKIPAAVQEHINRHYKMAKPIDTLAATNNKKILKVDSLKYALPVIYDLNVAAAIHESPFIEAFLPQMTQLDTMKIRGNMNQTMLTANVSTTQIVYGTNTLQGFVLNISERDSGMTYNATLDKFSQGKLQLVNTKLTGEVDANLLSAHITSDDDNGMRRFAVGADLQKEGTEQVLSLNKELMLNYVKWNVVQPNKIVFGGSGFYVQNLKFSGNGASISANSEPASYNAPLTAVIDNFQISDIMQMISGDTLFADGVISGNAELKQFKPSPMIDVQFAIKNLAVMNDTIGDVNITAANTDASTINAQLDIKGNGNDVQVKGAYYTTANNGNNFDFDVLLNELRLKSFEGFAQKQIHNSSGALRGKLNVLGTVAAPVITGDLNTDNLQTTVSVLNATFRMPQEKISFGQSGIHFNQFKILDSAGQPAIIDGSILTKDFRDMNLDLDVKANKWKALSSSKGNSDLFYGSLLLTTHLAIEGSLTKPSVSGNLKILKGTDLTVVLPESSTGIEDQAGVVVFVDKNTQGKLKPKKVKDTVAFAKVGPGSDINVNLTTEEEAEFNVIIDQATGDFLRVRGKATLNTAIDAGGALTLNGIYELKEGAYELNYNLIKRNFQIKSGSIITFAGDPLSATMNVTAVYKANVAPYDLVEKQVPDPAQLVYYRQPLPFNVQLSMNGPLMEPQLSFDIVLPENGTYRVSSDAVQLIEAKLTQIRTDTSELNKQVFALLILNRFITDDPFSSDGGGGAEFAAKQSVSRFLGEQLNQFANHLIKGVDLSVDIASTEDYTTGQRRERTDLNVAASKRLFNDRLKITIGNNFELEGPQTKSTNPNSSVIPGNLAIDYNLSADGRYVIRAYRQNQDEGVIQGFVTETGVNFIINYDYNRFKSLFTKKKGPDANRQNEPEHHKK